MKFFPLIWRNLMRKKLRTILTLLSVFVAFLLYGFLCIIKLALTGGVDMAGADRLMVRHKVSFIRMLPISYKERMERIPGVSAVTHATWFGGIYKDDPKNFIGTFPVDPDSYFSMFSDMMSISPEVMKAWKEKRNGAVVGKATLERFAESDGWKIGSVIPFTSPIWPAEGKDQWEFEIVGTYDTTKKNADNTSFFFRYDYFDETRARAKGEVGWFSVRVANPDEASAIAAKIDQQFANSSYETKSESEAAAMQGWAAQIGNIGAILIGVLGAVFFTILLVAGNTMSLAVRERTQELGALKALGFTHEHVLAMIIAESCLITMLGGFLGLGVAWLIAAAGSPMPDQLPVFVFTGRDLLIGVGIVFFLGIAAGALPGFEAKRLRIADALRRGG